MEAAYKDSVADLEGKRVTKWYVFGEEVANGFEGGGWLNRLGDGQKTVRTKNATGG